MKKPKVKRPKPREFDSWKITPTGLASTTYIGRKYELPAPCLWDADLFHHIESKCKVGAMMYGDFAEAVAAARIYHADKQPMAEDGHPKWVHKMTSEIMHRVNNQIAEHNSMQRRVRCRVWILNLIARVKDAELMMKLVHLLDAGKLGVAVLTDKSINNSKKENSDG